MIPLRERCNSRWRTILPALGIDPSYLTGKNGPCPLCAASHDRWRFDNKRGDGTWICTHCGAGQGIKLAMKFMRQPFDEVARRIERIIGDAPRAPAQNERSEQEKRGALNRLWQTGKPVQAGDPVDLWLRRRGFILSSYPPCLRTCLRTRYSGRPVSFHPAMLAKVLDPAGKPVMIHKTYLTATGGKAPVEQPRMFCQGIVPRGSAVRLAAPGAILGVAEGIETALAAAQLFRISVWATLSDWGLMHFQPPVGTERLIIFGDNDANGAGQKAAYGCASRLPPCIVGQNPAGDGHRLE
jgi:putative DNA primase/helicase